MGGIVVCYSLGGKTRKVCERIAELTGAPLHQLAAPGPGPGPLAFVVWSMRTVFGTATPVEAPDALDPGSADWAVLAAPLWVGKPALPMSRWLDTRPALPDRIGLVITSGAAKRPDGAFSQMAAEARRRPAATLHLPEGRVGKNSAATEIATFCDTMTG
ncbi:hypothetical protein [Rhodosalinus sp. 5P4]|uniref:hypothetical protein n=1 Tax=Rhodosalinus sp. 5P4 TaxID=3239196 RepID=UPI003524A2C8